MENRMSSIETNVQGVNTALGDVNSKLDMLLIRRRRVPAPASNSDVSEFYESPEGLQSGTDEESGSSSEDVPDQNAQQTNTYHDVIRNRDETIVRLHNEIRQLTTEKEQIQSGNLQAAQGGLVAQQQITELRQQMRDEQGNTELLRAELEDLRQQLALSNDQGKQSSGTITVLQDENRGLKSEIEELEETLDGLEKDYDEKNTQYNGMMHAKIDSDKEVRRLQQQLRQLSQASVTSSVPAAPAVQEQPVSIPPVFLPQSDNFPEVHANDIPEVHEKLLTTLLRMMNVTSPGDMQGSGTELTMGSMHEHTTHITKKKLNSKIQKLFINFMTNVEQYSKVNTNDDRKEVTDIQYDLCIFLFKSVAHPVQNLLDIRELTQHMNKLTRAIRNNNEKPTNQRENFIQKAIIELFFIIAQDERITIIDAGKLSIIPSYLLLQFCQTLDSKNNFGFTFDDGDTSFLNLKMMQLTEENLFSGIFPFSKHTFPLRIYSLKFDDTIYQSLKQIEASYQPNIDRITRNGKQLSEKETKAVHDIDLVNSTSIWLPDKIQDEYLGFLFERPKNLFELRCFLCDPMMSISHYKAVYERMCLNDEQTTEAKNQYKQTIDEIILNTATTTQAIYVNAIVMLSVTQKIYEIAYKFGVNEPDHTKWKMKFILPTEIKPFGKQVTGLKSDRIEVNFDIPGIVFTSASKVKYVTNEAIYEELNKNIFKKFKFNFEIIVFFQIIHDALQQYHEIDLQGAFKLVVNPGEITKEELFKHDFVSYSNYMFCGPKKPRNPDLEINDLYNDEITKRCNIKNGMKNPEKNTTSFADFFSRIAQANNGRGCWQNFVASTSNDEDVQNEDDMEAGAPEPPQDMTPQPSLTEILSNIPATLWGATPPQGAAGGSVQQTPVTVPLKPPIKELTVVSNPSQNGAGAATNATGPEVVEDSGDRQWLDEKIAQLQKNFQESKRRIMSGGNGNYWGAKELKNKNPLGYFRQQMKVLMNEKQTPISQVWKRGEKRPKPNKDDIEAYMKLLNDDVLKKAESDAKWNLLEDDPRWTQIRANIFNLKDM